MANGEDMALGFFSNYEEERRIRAEEFQIRYEERKRQKKAQRDRIEAAAAKLCQAAEKAADNANTLTPEELVQISAALNHAATAMQMAEQYAEYTSYYTGGFCAV